VPVGLIVLAAYYIFDLGFQPDGSGWSFLRFFKLWKNVPNRNGSQSNDANMKRLHKEGYGIQTG
jgi:hypothetical protein